VKKVILFLFSRLNFITFLLLELLCIWLIFSTNPYQSAAFFNSSNAMSGNALDLANNTKGYLKLKDINDQLVAENAVLLKLLSNNKLTKDEMTALGIDTIYVSKFSFVAAKVINSSTANFKNYLTINKGTSDNLLPGMGVVCKEGIVGKIKACSKNFSTITSILNKENLVSCKLKRSNALGTLRWDGIDPKNAKMLYVARHLVVRMGDTIVTSEQNSVFPEGEMVGVIKKFKVKGDESFYNIEVELSTDFSTLNYVYVVKNKLKFQLDSLESVSTFENNENK